MNIAMLKHLFSRAVWRGTKCQLANILGIVLLFTILHIFFIKTVHYKALSTTSKEKQQRQNQQHVHEVGNQNEYVTGERAVFEEEHNEITGDQHNATYEQLRPSVMDTNDAGEQYENITDEHNRQTSEPPVTVPKSGQGVLDTARGLPFQPLAVKSMLTNKAICTVPETLPEPLQERRNIARAACQRLRKDLPKRWSRKDRGPSSGMLSKMRWDQQHHLLYCHLPKVASTTWAWHLLRAVGLKDEEIASHRNVHILLQERLPPPIPENLDSGFLNYALSFLVTRHPFHRLVSAYKNKIVEAEKRRQHYVDLRKYIVEKYHRPVDPNLKIPTFRDFCEYVADDTEKWLNDLDHVPPPDLHWMPMTYVCSPCNLRYDVFSKMETMEEDTKFIASQCGLEDVINSDVMLNPSSFKEEEEDDVNSAGASLQNSSSIQENNRLNEHLKIKDDPDDGNPALESKTYGEYFNELTKAEIERLFRIYRFDFEIFGYSVADIR